jgi:hypothetical protein
MVILTAAMLAGVFAPAQARTAAPGPIGRPVVALAPTSIPLPRPRPADPAVVDDKPDGAAATAMEPAAPDQPPAPTACRLGLTEAIAIAPSVASIGACGGDDLVRLEAVVLPDRRRVAVKPAAILRCDMAAAVADWIRTDMAPLAASLDSALGELDNFDSFSCRGRNRVVSAKLSEHGRANALDIRGIKLINGQMLSLTDRDVARDVREKVLASVCGRFTTVLGPGSDGYHENHIHLDLAERHNGYRICQWQIDEPMPVAAPLLPQPRPEQAPPREVASQEFKPQQPEPKQREVGQLKVQPATPPPVSLSPVPLAKQSAGVAKPLAGKPDVTKSDATKSDLTKPDAAKANRAKPDTPRREVSKPEPPAKPALSLVPSGKTTERATRPKSPRSKSARARTHHRPPELPALLRRMFD